MRHLINFILLTLFSFSALAADFLGSGAVKETYKELCASCHGKDLSGNMANSLLDNVWLTGGEEADIYQAIAEGVKGSSMPAWEDRLSDSQIRALVLLILEERHLASSTSEKGGFKKPAHIETKHHNAKIDLVASDNDVIWAFDFLPDGSVIYTRRDGKLIVVNNNTRKDIIGIPQVWHHDQGGLLDVAVHPDYKSNGWIYLSFSEKTGLNDQGQAIGTLTVVRGKIINGQWSDNQVIFRPDNSQHVNRGWHFGSRFALQPPYLFFSIGDEGYPADAQSLSRHNGKIHRTFEDGSIPQDNPYKNENGSVSSIWTLGNRNPQGLTFSPNGNTLWSAEHGPRGGDELNQITRGANYGWPLVTLGMNYDGTPMPAVTSSPDHVDPVHAWTPSIAVSSIAFYTGEQFSQWRGDLFAGSLAFQQLHRLSLRNGAVAEDEVVLKGMGRIRDVQTGPDGGLYIAINNKSEKAHRILRLSAINE